LLKGISAKHVRIAASACRSNDLSVRDFTKTLIFGIR
jgi:hypothetical protein